MDTSNDDKAQADVGLLGEVPYRSDPLQAAKLATLAALSGLDEHIRSTQKVSFQARVNAWMLNCFGAGSVDVISRRPKLQPIDKEALAAIREAAQGRVLSMRHVKGHKEGDGRNWVNEQCDAEARRHMQAMRAERWLLEDKAS